MNIGEAIKNIRRAKGLKQCDVARQSGITQSYLSRVENDVNLPNIYCLKSIANVLDVALPIIIFESLEEKDIKPEKLETFHVVYPILKSLITKLS